MIQERLRLVAFVAFVALAAVALAGCDGQAVVVPPSPVPASCSSNENMGGLHFAFRKWPQGLAIMFIDDVSGGTNAKGGLYEDTYREDVAVRRNRDGIGYEWHLATTDGRSAELTINGLPYDLNKGSLFAIEVDGDDVVVHQLDRDLSALTASIDRCTVFVLESPDVLGLFRDPA